MYPLCNSMKLSKNVISGCHGNHFIELSREILAYFCFVARQQPLTWSKFFYTFCYDGDYNDVATHHH